MSGSLLCYRFCNRFNTSDTLPTLALIPSSSSLSSLSRLSRSAALPSRPRSSEPSQGPRPPWSVASLHVHTVIENNEERYGESACLL